MKHTGRKGQVFVIIGVVIAISLLMIKVGADFDFAIKKRSAELEADENEIMSNIENELEESYDIAVKKGGGHLQLNRTLRNYTMFMRENMESGDFGSIYSFSTYDNSTLKVSLWNLLGEEIENAAISQNLTGANSDCGDLPDGGDCYVEWDTPGRDEDYTVNITYTDTSGAHRSETYTGRTGELGNYTAYFYRIEVRIRKTTMSGEGRGRSEPQR